MSNSIRYPAQLLDESSSTAEVSGIGIAHRKFLNTIFACLGILICIYLIWPAFNAVHLEGFTAQTESIAFLKSVAPGVEHDPYLPLVSQFIYQTRSAVIDMLALIYQVAPQAGDLAFKGLVLSSFFLLLISSIVFAKRWGNVHPIFSFIALTMTPGIPETAFFFNDNIISASLASLALALIAKNRSSFQWLLSGVFMGVAILSRVDAIFMLPMIFGMVFYANQSGRERFFASFIISAAIIVVLMSSAIYHGFSLIDVFATAKRFVVVVGEKYNWAWVRIFFIGLSALPLLAVGIYLSFKKLKQEQAYMGLLVFIIYPILLALFAPKASEVRYIFPLLAPMVALHVGLGLRWVYEQCLTGSGKKYRYALGIAIFVTVVTILPPAVLKLHDGPRAVIGRIWSPVLWSGWHAAVNETMNRTQQLVAELDKPGTNILISTHFNDEFYLRLRLIQAGFLPMNTSSSYPGCHGFSVFKKGNSTVAHVRTDPQYRIAPLTFTYNAALQVDAAFSCKGIQNYNKAYITTFGKNDMGLPSEVYAISVQNFEGPLTVEFNDARRKFTNNDKKLPIDYGILSFMALSSDEIVMTQLKSKNYLAMFPEYDQSTGKIVTIENYSHYYRLSFGPSSEFLMRVREEIKMIQN